MMQKALRDKQIPGFEQGFLVESGEDMAPHLLVTGRGLARLKRSPTC